jgi:hypothetical protein
MHWRTFGKNRTDIERAVAIFLNLNEVTISQTICSAAGQYFEETKCPAVYIVTVVKVEFL